MATQLQLRRGTTSENGSFTGAIGEVTVDTDKDTLVVHDGATAGGHEVAKADGSNIEKLTKSGATKIATTTSGVDVTGTVTMDGGSTSADFNFGDDDKALFGVGNDLKIYHSSNNQSYIHEVGSGDLNILATNLKLQDASGATKLATTASGCDITGNLAVSGGNLDVSGTSVNNGCRVQFTNAAASKVYQISAGQSGVSNNNFVIRNVTDSTFPLVIDDNSNVSIPHGNLTVGANLEVQGADVTVTANIKHAGDGDTFFGFNANDSWRVVTGGAEGIKVDSSQNVSIPNGDLTIASGNGVYLGGTATANKLDDYEEGTWTPAFKDSSNNSASASTATGTYVKIGSVVHIQGTLIDINTSGLTGGDSALLGGFPFTINNSSATRAHGLLQSNDVTFTEGTVYLQGNNGQVQAAFKFNKTGAGAQQIAVNGFTSGSADVFFSMSYQTTA
jgi:hypothetical protein